MNAVGLRLEQPVGALQTFRHHHLNLHGQRMVLPKRPFVDFTLLGTTFDDAFLDAPAIDDGRDRLQLDGDLPPPALVIVALDIATDDRLSLLDDGFIESPEEHVIVTQRRTAHPDGDTLAEPLQVLGPVVVEIIQFRPSLAGTLIRQPGPSSPFALRAL
jgi:hypothetical protein